MKILFRLNFFAVGLPFGLALLAIFNVDLLFYAFLSTMITGALQIVIALIMLIIRPKNIDIYIYFLLTILFFVLWLGFKIEYWLFALPPALAIYLTHIVGTEYQKSIL